MNTVPIILTAAVRVVFGHTRRRLEYSTLRPSILYLAFNMKKAAGHISYSV